MLLRWALIFFILAVLAGIFGFGFAAVTFAAAAKLLFYAFIIIFVLMLIGHLVRRV
jgi:uncharacterized membrane protein YtjA (UPF0391 family)